VAARGGTKYPVLLIPDLWALRERFEITEPDEDHREPNKRIPGQMKDYRARQTAAAAV
jgi:hypothetical protein